MRTLIKELKVDLHSDEWGHAMSAWFDVAAEAFHRCLDIPSHWEYRPSPCNDPRDLDSWFARVAVDASDDELIKFGNLMERYTRILQRAGKDY